MNHMLINYAIAFISSEFCIRYKQRRYIHISMFCLLKLNKRLVLNLFSNLSMSVYLPNSSLINWIY